MKKALILYPSSIAACGIGTWVEAVSDALRGHGWDVTVGLSWGGHFHDPLRVEAFRPSLKTVRMDARTGTEEGRIQAIIRAIETELPQVVLLTVLNSAFEAVRRLRFAGNRSFRLIAVNHGNLAQQAASLLAHRDLIDMAVCVSRLSYRAMGSASEGFALGRLRHISNAVGVPAAPAQRAEAALRIGYAGRLEDDKRAGDVAPFFRLLHERLPQAVMWVAGRGAYAPEMEALAREVPRQFYYFGELPPRALADTFYPELDLLMHFSPAEAWGYSIAEAMSYGVVPVTSAFRGQAEDGLVLDGETGLVFPVGDVARAAELAATLLGDPAWSQQLSARAAAHVRHNFSLELFGNQWIEALESCLELPQLPAPERPASLDAKGPVGIPWPWWERIRRMMGRRIAHASSGEEWPHFRCGDRRLINEMDSALVERDTSC